MHSVDEGEWEPEAFGDDWEEDVAGEEQVFEPYQLSEKNQAKDEDKGISDATTPTCVLYLISKQKLDHLIALPSIKNPISTKDAVVLCFDEEGNSSSSGARRYEAYFVENGQWVVDQGRKLLRMNMGDLKLSSSKPGVVQQTSEHLKIMQEALEMKRVVSFHLQEKNVISTPSDHVNELTVRNQEWHRLQKTATIAAEAYRVLNVLMNPPDDLETLRQESDERSILDTLYQFGKPQDELVSPSALVAGTEAEHGLLSSESQSMKEVMIQAAELVGPQHFESIETDDQDNGILIFSRFLKEFVQGGALDTYATRAREHIQQTVVDRNDQEAQLSFVEGVVRWLRYIGSEDIWNPRLDPLNKYVDIQHIERMRELQPWLETNQTHPEYDQRQAEYSHLSEQVCEARRRAMEEGGEYLLNMNRQLNPELRDLKTTREINKYYETKAYAQQRKEFSSLVLKDYSQVDVFEPNCLRKFSEELSRFQRGKIYYEFVCESFSSQHSDSEVHKRVQEIWALSHLDTIHHRPLEARSTMPNGSTDGEIAPNFGYRTPQSLAYRHWTSHPMARASGDVIVDAFHWTVDFGCSLDVGTFLNRLFTFHNPNRNHQDLFLDPLDIDSFLYPFLHFLYRQRYGCDFKRDSNDPSLRLFQVLLQAAGSEEVFRKSACESLEAFRDFAREMRVLRPDGQPLSEQDNFRGLVFGIGFNGALFKTPVHSQENPNEIWLSFSETGRVPGGILLLTFLKTIATSHNEAFTKTLDGHIQLPRDFSRYKALIQHHVNIQIKNAYEVPNHKWNSQMLRYMSKKRASYEGFLSQLEQDLPFNSLSQELQQWIRKVFNWYCVPHNAVVGIPDEMAPQEHKVQKLSRRLLFDALVRRPFSQEWPQLMPHLFTHWKAELISLLPEALVPLIQAVKSLSEVPTDLSPTVLNCLDQLVWKIHPTLRQEWNRGKYGIEEQFVKFMAPKIETLDKKIISAQGEIRAQEKSLIKKPDKKAAILPHLEKAKKSLNDYSNQKQGLPIEPSQLSQADYQAFYEDFFNGRNVGQCVETVFAKVVGHDKFYSVYISKKVNGGVVMDGAVAGNKTLQLGNWIAQDVIPPCDKNCQYHVLGHVYVGNALTYQSADRLDTMRQTHNCDAVPRRLMPAEHFRQIARAFYDRSERDEMTASLPVEGAMLTQYQTANSADGLPSNDAPCISTLSSEVSLNLLDNTNTEQYQENSSNNDRISVASVVAEEKQPRVLKERPKSVFKTNNSSSF